VIAAINAEGIPCMGGSCAEIYLEKAFIDARLAPAQRLPVAQALGAGSLCFLLHPTLSESDVRDMCAAVGKVMRAVSRG
jgi:dTDP-4-amino-4,6-dideoxygalactose transaminase